LNLQLSLLVLLLKVRFLIVFQNIKLQKKLLSKNQIKLISSLSQKKFRNELGLFVAEGTKLVLDLSKCFNAHQVFATSSWANEFKSFITCNIQLVSDDELNKISNQKTPQGVLVVFKKNFYDISGVDFSDELCLALDNIQDPGNFGTIIRIADWFGIHNIYCSLLTVDAYSPKAIQATMGALNRVKVHYVDLNLFLSTLPVQVPIYGTFMDGADIYTETLTPHGIIVMGNEGNGISKNIEKLVNKRLLIPNFPKNEPSSESLNVSVATALVCAEFRRRQV